MKKSSSENRTIRAVMNQRVAEEWTKWSKSSRKNYLKKEIFIKPDVSKRVIEEYGKAENTDNMIYVLVDLGNPERVKTIESLYAENLKGKRKTPEVMIIDAKEKVSASITK